jgi:hypothetical protein
MVIIVNMILEIITGNMFLLFALSSIIRLSRRYKPRNQLKIIYAGMCENDMVGNYVYFKHPAKDVKFARYVKCGSTNYLEVESKFVIKYIPVNNTSYVDYI